MTSPLIACAFCANFFPERRDGNYCKAFPEPPGIPREIARGDNHHLEPWPGDNGIRYEPIPGFEDVMEGVTD